VRIYSINEVPRTISVILKPTTLQQIDVTSISQPTPPSTNKPLLFRAVASHDIEENLFHVACVLGLA
jgi:hypothetical protein